MLQNSPKVKNVGQSVGNGLDRSADGRTKFWWTKPGPTPSGNFILRHLQGNLNLAGQKTVKTVFRNHVIL